MSLKRKNGISVIVCCYNSVSRLKPTLEHLFSQQIPETLNWEIIVVDNNSTDHTAGFASELHQKSGGTTDFKVVFEPKPGLSYARKAGFRNSEYEYVLMVDDDNWLSNDYVAKAYQTLNSDPSIGMVGGLGDPELSCNPPEWFQRYAYCYATGPQTLDSSTGFTNELYGAGLALRLSVLDLLEEKGFNSLLSDRVGNTLLSGGDTELCMAFRMAGAKLYYRSDISFKHELPNGRINWKYLRRLFDGFGMTKAGLDIYSACIKGYEKPTDGRFPFWFNRAYFLFKNLIRDIPILIRSKFVLLEGNDELLIAIGKLGQLRAIIKMRRTYLSKYDKVYQLAEALKHE